MKTIVESLIYGENKDILFKDFFYVPEDEQERAFGEIYAFLQIKSNNLDKQALVMTILDTFKDVFYRNLNLETAESAFEKTIKELNTLINSLYEKRKDSWDCQLSAVIAVRSGNNLFLSQTGSASSYLHRSSFLADIIQEEWELTDFTEVFKNIASGDLVQGDKIIFSSDGLGKYISKKEFTDICNFNDTKKIGDILQSKIKIKKNDLLGVLIIDLQKVNDKNTGGVINNNLSTKNTSNNISRIKSRLRKGNININFNKFNFGKIGSFFSNLFHKTRENTKNMTSKMTDGVSGKDSFAGLKKKKPQINLKTDNILNSVKKAGKNVGKSASNFFSNKMQGGLIINGKKIDRRNFLIGAGISLVVLIVSVSSILSRQQENAKINEAQEKLAVIKDNISRSERLMLYDKVGARNLLATSLGSLDQLKTEGADEISVELSIDKIQSILDNVDGVERIKTPELLADLSQARNNINALGIVNLEGEMYVYDYNSWYSVVLDNVNVVKSLTEDTDEVISAVDFPRNSSAVLYTKNNRVVEFDKRTFNEIPTDDGNWKSAVDIGNYSNYLYLLDPKDNQIWKYRRKNNSYGVPLEYNFDADLTQAVDMSIDGDFFVLNKDGSVLRMFKAEVQDYKLSGLNDPITNPKKILVTFEGGLLYVLDKNRVVLYNKEKGTYIKQFVFEIEEDLRDIYVNNEETVLLVLTEKSIYKVDLNS